MLSPQYLFCATLSKCRTAQRAPHGPHCRFRRRNKMMQLVVLFALPLLLLVALMIRKYRQTYSFWSLRGVAGPTPLPFFGNSLPAFFTPLNVLDVKNERR